MFKYLCFSVKKSLIVLTFALIAAQSTFYAGVHKIIKVAHQPAYRFHEVYPNRFYRSAQMPPDDLKKYIQRYGIKTVINLRGAHAKELWWLQEKEACEACSVKHVNLPLSYDKLPTKENLRELLNLYASARYPILVHCRSGSDRTGEAAAVWLLDQRGVQQKEALEQLSAKFHHSRFFHPAKKFFVKIWRGRDWALREYDPAKYPAYAPRVTMRRSGAAS